MASQEMITKTIKHLLETRENLRLLCDYFTQPMYILDTQLSTIDRTHVVIQSCKFHNIPIRTLGVYKSALYSQQWGLMPSA